MRARVRKLAAAAREARRLARAERERTADAAAPPSIRVRDRIAAPWYEHGQHIYVFSHLQTKQVIHSLTPAMENTAALQQLPFLGKQTVPAALRKDLWYPMAQIHIPTSLTHAPKIGLRAFQQMREFRRLHELSWKQEDMVDEKGVQLSRKSRGRKLRDQKANSVADMAAALMNVVPGGKHWPGKDKWVRLEEQKKRELATKTSTTIETRPDSGTSATSVPSTTVESEVTTASESSDLSVTSTSLPKNTAVNTVKNQRKAKSIVPEVLEPIVIKWADILDAEYASKWPKAVVHDQMLVQQNNRVRQIPEWKLAQRLKHWKRGTTRDGSAEEQVGFLPAPEVVAAVAKPISFLDRLIGRKPVEQRV